MLTHPTLDQLRALKLDGMADAFLELEQQDAARDLTHAEWLALLVDREIANRTTKRTQIRLRAARLRYSQASVEDVNYRAQRQLDKALFQQLATCRWIAEKRNLLVGGKCGLGKTWLACALAQRACREGYRAYYARMPRLFAQLELAHGDGRFARLFRMLTQGRSAHFGRSRSRPPQRRPAARSPGDHRGPAWPLLDADRQSAPRQSLARPHWRAHLRRCHPRSPRPQRLSPRARRRALHARDRPGQRSAGAKPGPDGAERQVSERSPEMSAVPCVSAAPVGQQAPPARAAAFDSWRSLRSARGSLLLTTGTACRSL